MSSVVSPKRALFIALSLLLTAVAPGCTDHADEAERPAADILRRTFPGLAARVRVDDLDALHVRGPISSWPGERGLRS